MHKSGADPATSNNDLNIDLTSQLRSNLPLLDHSTGARFFKSTGQPAAAKADTSGKVIMKYSDFPSTPFATVIEKGGIYYDLSGIAAQSFFFTAFGAWDGIEAIILSTFYWDIKHCENIQPGDITKTKSFGAVNVAPFRYCKTGGCDLGEAGADQFGEPAKQTLVSWYKSNVLGSIFISSNYAGPSTFSIGCQSSGGSAAKQGHQSPGGKEVKRGLNQ